MSNPIQFEPIDFMEGYTGLSEAEVQELDDMWDRFDNHDCHLKEDGACQVHEDFTGYVNSLRVA